MAHPFATGGGGTLFEYKVATLLAVDLITGRLSPAGGSVAELQLQSGPGGFDDIRVFLELLGGSHRVVHVQCRHKQLFTSSDTKFRELLVDGLTAIGDDEHSYASGARRLAVVVDESSPGHVSMARLCDLARSSSDLKQFASTVAAHSGNVAARWAQCGMAAGDTRPDDLYRLLASLDVRAVSVGSHDSRDSIEMINHLAALWIPPDLAAGLSLGDAIFKHLTVIGPHGGAADLDSLARSLRSSLPDALAATTRRARLGRRLEAGRQRVAHSLAALGVDYAEAGRLAGRVLTAPITVEPSKGLTVLTGPMGVGKSAEAERLHRAAVERAMQDPKAPIPVFLHAREVSQFPLDLAVLQRSLGLGDPSHVGVHLIVDGLDEVGLRIGDLDPQIATLLALWPNSSVIAVSRPQAGQEHFNVTVVQPLSENEAVQLISELDVRYQTLGRGRNEIDEILRRPLFAVLHALQLREGKSIGIREAQLVQSAGQRAMDELGEASEAAFEILARLACRIIDSGGGPVELRELRATPSQLAMIDRSRLTHVADGRASFQLAVLTEWFAATELLRDHAMLKLSVSSPLRAHRWRYALVQALLQGSSQDVDNIMSEILDTAPATAAWVHHEVCPESRRDRDQRISSTPLEAGARISLAANAWLRQWPTLFEGFAVGGAMPTLGIDLFDASVVTAWSSDPATGGGNVIQLPPDVDPFDRHTQWRGACVGAPKTGESWPWEWTRWQFHSLIDNALKDRELLADIDLCWPELAWDYAHLLVGRSPTVQSEPISLGELQSVIRTARARSPEGIVLIGSVRGTWQLDHGAAFVADLERLGFHEVAPPWAPPDTRGPSTGFWWSTDRLLDRLHASTKVALDVYKAVVERHLPMIGAELNTFQLLPAVVLGTVTQGDPADGVLGGPRFTWQLEPLPAGSPNSSEWRVGAEAPTPSRDRWEQWVGQVRSVRGDFAEHAVMSTHHGEPNVFSSTPAGSLALSLLASDLKDFHWTRSSRFDINSGSTRPRFHRPAPMSSPPRERLTDDPSPT